MLSFEPCCFWSLRTPTRRGEDMGVLSDDEDVEVEEVKGESGFGSVVVVDNLPQVPSEKYEKLSTVGAVQSQSRAVVQTTTRLEKHHHPGLQTPNVKQDDIIALSISNPCWFLELAPPLTRRC